MKFGIWIVLWIVISMVLQYAGLPQLWTVNISMGAGVFLGMITEL